MRSNLKYYAEKEFLKERQGSNYKTPQNDKYYFAHGMIDLKNYNFIAGDTKVKIQKCFRQSRKRPKNYW